LERQLAWLCAALLRSGRNSARTSEIGDSVAKSVRGPCLPPRSSLRCESRAALAQSYEGSHVVRGAQTPDSLAPLARGLRHRGTHWASRRRRGMCGCTPRCLSSSSRRRSFPSLSGNARRGRCGTRLRLRASLGAWRDPSCVARLVRIELALQRQQLYPNAGAQTRGVREVSGIDRRAEPPRQRGERPWKLRPIPGAL